VDWDVSLTLRVVGRVYGYRKRRKKKGLIVSVLWPMWNGEGVWRWACWGGVCVRSCQQNEQLGLYGTVKAMWLDRYVPSHLVGT
jgi:hypothetical protein